MRGGLGPDERFLVGVVVIDEFLDRLFEGLNGGEGASSSKRSNTDVIADLMGSNPAFGRFKEGSH